MIREINLAEGKPGTVSFLLLFGGGSYLLGRHSRSVPTGTVTRVVFFAFDSDKFPARRTISAPRSELT